MSDSEHSDLDRAACSAALAAFLAEARDLRRAATADAVHGRRRQRLREWQAARLARTHADLLASPRYGTAATFFLSDLYGPKDFSERDAEVERILPLMTTMLPVSGLRTLLLAVEVDALSERFDAAMVEKLGAQLDDEQLSEAAYAAAYRAVGDRAGRTTQLRLIGETGEALEALARKSFVRGALKMMHGPAHLAGLGELHAFLERGFEAFRSMRDASEFLETIIERERAIAAAMFAGRDLPD
ncbi:hypothetical protein [Dechloromonas sp. H13]|uniref:FFLEELY motif protein n=1 Tax=Dechloromonas sp. H13 TaxID=2570193 RepID=UPI0012913720|nr:hypothetical protein [Dechloromonas sp. H13]